jgi:hypothetical protein
LATRFEVVSPLAVRDRGELATLKIGGCGLTSTKEDSPGECCAGVPELFAQFNRDRACVFQRDWLIRVRIRRVHVSTNGSSA